MTDRFHLGDLLSITDGRLLSPDHIDGVYRIVDHVTGEKHMTHQLPRAAETIRPWLIEQLPWLDGLGPPQGADGPDMIAWLSWATGEHGEFHEVEPMPFGMYVGREPFAEAEEMAPVRVLTVDALLRPDEVVVPAAHLGVRFDSSAFTSAMGKLVAGFRSLGEALRQRSAPPRCYGPPPLAINGHAYRRRIRARRR